MPATITVNQVSKPAGVAGRSRDDLDVGLLVTCSNTTAESTYAWTLVDVPIRSALVRGMTGTGATFAFTPDVKGTYRITLRVNGSEFPSDNDVIFGAVLSFGDKTLGWRYLAAGEADNEDNTVKTGLGFPGDINPRGWATENDLNREQQELAAYEVANAVVVSPGPGTDNLVKLDSLTGQLDPTVIPSDGDSGPSTITGATNEQETVLGLQRVIGGFTLDGSDLTGASVFRWVGAYDAHGVAGDARVQLYDMGAVGAGPVAGVLRAEVSLPFSTTAGIKVVDQTLTVTDTPVSSGEIYNAARKYEVRLHLDSAVADDSMTVNWAGITTGGELA